MTLETPNNVPYSSFDIEFPEPLSSRRNPIQRTLQRLQTIGLQSTNFISDNYHTIRASCITSFVAVNLLLLILLLSTNILSLANDFDGVIGTLDYVFLNLETAPIEDIIITIGRCPEHYIEQALGEWPGMQQGCYCPAQQTIDESGCTIAQKPYCEVIPTTRPQTIHSWKGMLFCAKRYSYHIEAVNYQCPIYHRLCNDLCIKESQNCPITKIVVQRLEKGFSPQVTVAREPFGQPVVDFWTSINGPPCFDTFQLPMKKYRIGYSLNKKLPADCGKYGRNWYYDVLDKQKEIELYVSNGFYYDLDFLADYLSKINLNMIYLNARKRLKIQNSEACLHLNSAKFDEMNINVRRLKGTTVVISIMEITAVILFLIYIAVLVFVQGQEIHKIDEVHAQRPSLAFGFFVILLLAFLSNQFTLSFEDSIQEIDEYFLNIVKHQCFVDENLNLAFQDYSELIPSEAESIVHYTIFMFWFSLISFLCTVAGTILTKLRIVS